MTTVTLSAEGGKYSIRCDGHAETPEVCAAVSALVQALQGWMHSAGAKIKKEHIEPGNCELAFSGVGLTGLYECDAVHELVSIGFLRLHATAPEQIKVIYE